MSESSCKLYIVIPVHNRLGATRECLESLYDQTYQRFHVIVVDDGSTDGTAEFVETNFPRVTVLRGNGELWWTGATNVGVEFALKLANETDYILTLNDDTFLPVNYLETMMSLASQTSNALIGSIALDYNRRDVRVNAGVRISWFSARYTKINLDSEASDSFYPASFLSGRGTLIPIHVFKAIGLYDARTFPHYAADYDFSLRAKQAGNALLLHPCCYLYSKTTLTGISNVYGKVSFSAWLNSFFSIKSSNNLKIRLRFGLRHAPLHCKLTFIVCDFCRVLLGTFRNQMKNLARP